MAGIDAIVNEILQESKVNADALLAEAQKNADEILRKAEEEKADMLAEAAEKTERRAADYGKRIDSQIELQQRQAVLTAKQKIIRNVIDQAYEHLIGLDDAAYFDMIRRLLKGVVQNSDGEILFGKKDLDRLPKDMARDVEKIASAKGGSLKVSKEPARIENGFILRYKGIDENCSFRALFDEKQDQLQDKVHQLLW